MRIKTLESVTAMKNIENAAANFIKNNIRCAYLCFSAEKDPIIKSISSDLKDMLRIPKSTEISTDINLRSIYMLVSPEDRVKLERAVSQTEKQQAPVAGSINLLRYDGSRIKAFGWMARRSSEDGDEIQAVFTDITDSSRIAASLETERIIKALTPVYDDIFEFDFKENTLKCVYNKKSRMLQQLQGIPMNLGNALNTWIFHKAAPVDRDRLKEFFKDCLSGGLKEDKASSIDYKITSSDGEDRPYKGVLLKTEDSKALFCITPVTVVSGDPVPKGNSRIRIRTFGYFDVFVDDNPIAFRSEKSKELLALLVDRRGGFVSAEEAISFLWENSPSDSLTLSRYRKVALRLKNTLEEYGISDIVEAVNGKRRIVTSRVSCDLFDYLSGKQEHSQLFKGSYLTNYSWAEMTLGELL